MDEKKQPNEEEKKEKKKKGILYAVIGILIIIIILLLLRSCGGPGQPAVEDDNRPTFDLTEDENSQEGERETKSQEEIQEELNKQVAEGMMNISMNLSPKFATGTSEGNLLIVNEEINRHPQVVQIFLKDTEDMIYQSGAIAVGSRVDAAKLDKDLEPGTYDCIAYFNSIDENTGDLLGKAAAEIKLTVEG